uniref:Transcription factor castor n=1 Tax=Cacopsylla melanoneura TaxID=428564 RepID=A0A8D8RYM5_9HEMI
MVNMSDSDAGAMLMAVSQHQHQQHNGGDADMMSDDMDSDPEEAPTMLNMIQAYAAGGEMKRNKRKNFKPRNIETNAMLAKHNSHMNEDDRGNDSSDRSRDSFDNSEYALDLSNSDMLKKGVKRQRTASPVERDSLAAPMDLSCSRSHSTSISRERKDSESYCSDSESDTALNGYHNSKYSPEPPPSRSYLFPPFLNQPTDASDLKEYAQKTVKELLEIYGLNSDVVTDVAESITKNVPISNFSSGKILESLSTKAKELREYRRASSPTNSQPPTPPKTPLSPNRYKSSVESMAAKFAVLSAPEPPSSTSPSPRIPFSLSHSSLLTQPLSQHHQDQRGSFSDDNDAASPSDMSEHKMSLGSSERNSLGGLSRRPSSPSSKSNVPLDYSRYVQRFGSSAECSSSYCKDLNYREHFHCLECHRKIFIKKEEMIRHFKWHKKRDESLQHGFMRYSPGDDCGDRYHNCQHNRKQTHYHCIQGTCDKVYISTSDVQMHANYHRKDSAIIQEGFQRLRATEECRTPYCAFFGQRTTHFHCRRDSCQYTFKNKADMEKHKTYHIKDEQLLKDGFKKFMKPDPCGFPGCRFSQTCNHIHCVRENCNYVLHSSGQLLSHKRKHERKDSEIAYRKFKLAQQAVNLANLSGEPGMPSDLSTSPGSSFHLLQQATSMAALNALHDKFDTYSNSSSEGGRGSPPSKYLSEPPTPSGYGTPGFHFKFSPGASLPQTPTPSGYFTDHSSSAADIDDFIEIWPKFMNHYSQHKHCVFSIKCPLHEMDHFHCKDAHCEMPFKCRDSAESHARMHDTQERFFEHFYQEGGGIYCVEGQCPKERHLHCVWEGCFETIFPSEKVEHFRSHDISISHYNSLDALFRRKRGRPPKNRVIEVWNDTNTSGMDTPQAIFTSFKLPKPNTNGPEKAHTESGSDRCSPLPLPLKRTSESPKPLSLCQSSILEPPGFTPYSDGCPDQLCSFLSRPHFHCNRPRCFFATDSAEELTLHSKEFHANVIIREGFLFFDKSVDCRLENCRSNKVTRHFHCIRPGCDTVYSICFSNKVTRHFHCIRPGCGYTFVRYPNMIQHEEFHLENASGSFNTSLESSSSKSKENFEPKSEIRVKKDKDILSSPPSPKPVPLALTLSPDNGPGKVPTEETIKQEPMEQLSVEVSEKSLQLLPEWMSLDRHEKYGPELSCSRPFCKLKRKEHYHCNACNQAFSELDRLKPHITKHSPSAIPHMNIKSEHNNNDENQETRIPSGLSILPIPPLDTPPELVPPSQYPPGFSAAMAAMANQQLALMTSQGLPFMPPMPALYSSPSGLMFGPPPGFNPHAASLMGNGLLLPPVDHAKEVLRRSLTPNRESLESKKSRAASSMRMLKDEPVPEGYTRYRFNEDCQYTQCGYREHQTHFHCMRQDCGYSFCDKTRFVQHTARHERLDTLMGGDFHQYRSNVSCRREDCVYNNTLTTTQNKASHFHCLKCEFVCTDTNKVVAHRRQHQKLDSIMAAGFEKFTPSQACTQSECIHSGKQTHYHCLNCQYAVVGLSQMTAHKYRHMDEQQHQQQE